MKLNHSKSSKQNFQGPFGLVVGHSVMIVLLLGLIASGLIAWIAHAIIQSDEEQRFSMAKQEVSDITRARLDNFLGVLQHTRAFLITNEHVSRQNFRTFLESVNINRSYSDLMAVGFSDRISAGSRATHERMARTSGYSRYRIWPKPASSGHLYPVKYIEPFDARNQRTLGFDMHSDSRLATAMDRARDSGQPALSEPVRLIQESESGEHPGFLLYLPVFKRKMNLSNVQERRDALLGFVYAQFRGADLFQGLFRSSAIFREGVGVRAFAGSPRSPGPLLFASEGEPQTQKIALHGPLEATETIHLFGQVFTMELYATKKFASSADRYTPSFVFFAGFLMTLLASGVVYLTGRQAASQRERALSEQAAREHLQELAVDLQKAAGERERHLRIQEKLFHIAQVVSAELDLEKVVQAVTDAATSLSGAQLGTFFYTATDAKGENHSLYALSGISRDHFDKFHLPKNSDFFPPTLTGGRAVRRDDITKDPILGLNATFFGLPHGHSSVRSYLAVSVVSRSGEVLGGLFLGHGEVGVFGEREEKVVSGLTAQAAIAIDNARLFQKSREAIDTRDEFLSICSHELRTPLTSMKLQNQLVQRTLESENPTGVPSRFEKMVLQSGRQIDRLVRLVEEMLDISRIRSGKLSLTPECLDLSLLVKECIERFGLQLQAAGCKVEVHTPATLIGNWDRLRLEQILVNLLSNATKYGAGKPVLVTLERVGNSAVLSVQDEGMGIAQEHQIRIFERFERAVSKMDVTGLGLGLYIVSQILENFGGSIRVESALGKGSRFIVTFPLDAQASATTPRLAAPAQQAARAEMI